MNERSEELLLDLLMKKAVEGLSQAEQDQLNQLESGRSPDESFEIAASAFALVDIVPEKMPANLRARVVADAERYFDAAQLPQSRIADESASRSFGQVPLWGWLGWAVAAVAIVSLFGSLWIRPEPQSVVSMTPTPTPVESPAQLRERLLEANLVNAKAEWGAGNMPDVLPSGDIVWSDEKQAGYMRFKGLPVNDPSKQTYQLWIFDETQDPKTPIDGGTFDVSTDGEIVIPIDAKLRARNPSMFAVTIEKPGGVVQSDRKRIVALAKVSA